jgi:hypothetical protein
MNVDNLAYGLFSILALTFALCAFSGWILGQYESHKINQNGKEHDSR